MLKSSRGNTSFPCPRMILISHFHDRISVAHSAIWRQQQTVNKQLRLLFSQIMSGEITCKLCKLDFPSRNKLFMHISAVHSENNNNVESNKRQCIESTQVTNGTVKTLEEQIRIVEEDSSYRIIVKPQGLATMGGKGPTLINSDHMLLPNAIALKLSYKKAVPCHRLDKETGGLVVCSKSRQAQIAISQCFRNKYVYKKYVAIVSGRMNPPEGYINVPLWSKESITRYVVSEYTNSAKYGTITTVTLYPITGRKHQLRRHLQHIGHSIIGTTYSVYTCTHLS